MIRIARVVSLALGLSALTAASAPAQTSLRMGGVLCRDCLKAARSSDILYHQASQWLLGFASGMNGALATINSGDNTLNIPSDQALKSAAAYCDANPTSTLANAAGEWYASLPKQAAPAQARAQTPPGPGLWLNLDASTKSKPLLERH